MRTYLIEPQTVFVPFLTRLLADAGLGVVATHDDVDGKDIVAHDPAAIFVDVDFFSRGAPNALCRIRQVVRNAAIIAFSETDDPTFEAACYISGATLLLSKRSGMELLLRSLRSVLAPQPVQAASV
ncbi:MAG: hypothetical protein M3R44_08295 [Candidatus Eremiobacteraeota bacterium]|nr:hypothetical protein [Candidatus Eremiobacteraeota bacterium]